MRTGWVSRGLAAIGLLCLSHTSFALDVPATSTALRIANMVTGGYLPASDPLFASMVAKVQAGDNAGAAAIAANSRYFANYTARRLALQMQTPALDASTGSDNDATAYLIAHFVGAAGVKPSISTIWSENATYLIDVGGTQTHTASLTATQLGNLNWSGSLVKVAGQNALSDTSATATIIPIPAKHVGGYMTLSDRPADNSFAMWGASAGTNLRMIEGMWEIATGMELLDFASANALTQDTPRFIPQYDPNFFVGQGQTACIACHGGGLSATPHGYSTVADVFNFDAKVGFIYNATPSNATRKSLGSDAKKRAANATCDLTKTPAAVCNPDSVGVDPNQGWNISKTWQASGILTRMGWTGPAQGQGLNELGSALGRANIVYENFVKRVVDEICPMGSFTKADVVGIANAANPYAMPAGTDDLRTIVAKVASHPTCL